jgi:nickel/cobalt transporter (NicO) family protein
MFDLQRWLYAEAGAQLRLFAGGAPLAQLLPAIGLAMLFGVLHAAMPGHGKTALVSYFLGRPSKVAAGFGVSALLVLTHVGSAIVLVLTGFLLLRMTIGGAGRAPQLETASAVLVIGIGLWLLYRAVRHRHAHAAGDGPLLAIAAGLVPCPLTTFIMVYAVANGIVIAGLFLTAGMALGMVATIACFAIGSLLLRRYLLTWLEKTEVARERLGRALEVLSAAAVAGFGVWLLVMR